LLVNKTGQISVSKNKCCPLRSHHTFGKNILESLTFFSKTNRVNFLAHIYLSGDDEKLITGNFIGDYVKGKNFLEISRKNQARNLILHRKNYHPDRFIY
jgi:hypothetical protein